MKKVKAWINAVVSVTVELYRLWETDEAALQAVLEEER